jgi:hypothetical protein
LDYEFLMPLSPIFQLYHGCQSDWWRKLKKATKLPQVIDILHRSCLTINSELCFWIYTDIRLMCLLCYSIFSFLCMFCRSLLYFFFCPLWCLFFFDIRILITPSVSSNSSYCSYKVVFMDHKKCLMIGFVIFTYHLYIYL